MSLIWNYTETPVEEVSNLCRTEKRVAARAQQKLKRKEQTALRENLKGDQRKVVRAPNDTSAIVGYDMTPNHPDLQEALRHSVWGDIELEMAAIQIDCTQTWMRLLKAKTVELRHNGVRLTKEQLKSYQNFATGEDNCTLSLLPVVSGYDKTIIPGPALWTHTMDYYTRNPEKHHMTLDQAKKEDAILVQVFLNKQAGLLAHYDRHIRSTDLEKLARKEQEEKVQGY